MAPRHARRAQAHYKAENSVMAGPSLKQPVYYMPGGSYGVSGVNSIKQNPITKVLANTAMETTKRIRSVANPSQQLYDTGFEREEKRANPLTHRLHMQEKYTSRTCEPIERAMPVKMPQLSAQSFRSTRTANDSRGGIGFAASPGNRGVGKLTSFSHTAAAGPRATFLRGHTPDRLRQERSPVQGGLPQASLFVQPTGSTRAGGISLNLSRSTNYMNELRIESGRPF